MNYIEGINGTNIYRIDEKAIYVKSIVCNKKNTYYICNEQKK